MELVSHQDLLFFIKDKADEARQIVLILADGGLLIRAVRLLADRLVKFVGDDDPLTTNQREPRAVTLAGIFKSVSKLVIVLVWGWLENYRQLKESLETICEINWELLRIGR